MKAVRALHGRGVSLWDQAWEAENDEPTIQPLGEGGGDATSQPCPCTSCEVRRCAVRNIILLPRKPERASHMWEALRYGWAMGAPLTPAMEEVFAAQRSSTRAVLLSFHVALRLSQGKGASKQKAAWKGMARMLIDLIEEILVLAGLEIPELVRRPLPRGHTVSRT